MAFNPFRKQPHENLTEDDLVGLIREEVAEGYYVEYKQSLPSTIKISRSIASLVNTNGGWYIVGINAPQRIPLSMPGFLEADSPDPASKITEVVKAQIDPTPIVYPQVVHLVNGRSVLVVYVPASQRTPFVTRDGRIYRRVVDSSDPIPEANRSAIDRLVDEGRQVGRRFANFCTDDRAAAKSEANDAWVSIFLSPYPHDEAAAFVDLDSGEEIQRLIAASLEPLEVIDGTGVTGNVPFNSGWPTERSIQLRQTPRIGAPFRALTAEFFTDGRARLHIPLSIYSRPEIHQYDLSSAKLVEAIGQINERDRWLLRFFDIGQLMLAVATLLSYYRVHVLGGGHIDELNVAISADGTWRLSPLFDLDEWADHIHRYGVPICERSDFMIPEDVTRAPRIKNVPNMWFLVGSVLAEALGVPRSMFTPLIVHAMSRAQERTRNGG